MPLAANLFSDHACPAFDGPKPHRGGVAMKGAAKVFIEEAPALRKRDPMLCIGPVDAIAAGSGSVYIEGMPAARVGDACDHGGAISTGAAKTFIG